MRLQLIHTELLPTYLEEVGDLRAKFDALKDAGWQREHMSQNRLAILPDVTHYEMAQAPALVPTVLPFLNGKSGTGNSAEQTAGTGKPGN